MHADEQAKVTGKDTKKERRKDSFRDLSCLKNINHDDVVDDDDDDDHGGGGDRGGLYRCEKDTLPFALPLASGPQRECWKERIIRVGT